MPALWAKALSPTKGCLLKCLMLAISFTNRDTSRNLFKPVICNTGISEFQLEVWNNRAKIGITAPFADAVDSSLHLHGPAFNRNNGVCHCAVGIIVGMDAEGRFNFFPDRLHNCLDLRGRVPPLVSQSTRQSAPAACAASRHFKANSGLSLYPSKKCSASKKTFSACFLRKRTELWIISRFSSSEIRRASFTWKSHVLPNIVMTVAFASTSAFKFGSSCGPVFRAVSAAESHHHRVEQAGVFLPS